MIGELSARRNIKLASSEASAAQQRVKERLKAGNFLAAGYHFCCDCQRITENIGNEFFKCCFCGSNRVKYNPKLE